MSKSSLSLLRSWAADVRAPSLEELPDPPADHTGWPWTEAGEPIASDSHTARAWPRISVVTPSYNQARYIEEAIRSVLLQGYPNLEYIIMDGGSTDGSVEIIRRYEPWFSYWVSQPDGGQSQAINQGWSRATGDVLGYLNTDDAYLSGALATAAQAFCEAPGAGMVYGSSVVIDEDGRRLRTWNARPFSLRAMLLDGNVVPQAATFFSREALLRVGFLAEQLEMIMDYELTIRVGTRYPGICLPATLSRFRDHTTSKSRTRFARTAHELIRLVDDLEADARTSAEVAQIRARALSRIHYEWAMACIAQGQRNGGTARHLRQSMRLAPGFSLQRPIQTGYIFKEILFEQLGLPSPSLFRSRPEANGPS